MSISPKGSSPDHFRMIDVTCAIIVDHNRVLVTRRSEGMPHALKWEFPGGKVKSGETPDSSIVREINEELGVRVEPEKQLPAVTHSYDSHSIRLIPFICRIMDGKVSLTEHHEYRWITCGEIDELDWLEADTGVVRMVKNLLC